jgi:hypothetical protein
MTSNMKSTNACEKAKRLKFVTKPKPFLLTSNALDNGASMKVIYD